MDINNIFMTTECHPLYMIIKNSLYYHYFLQYRENTVLLQHSKR
jgi:hypothetical protein